MSGSAALVVDDEAITIVEIRRYRLAHGARDAFAAHVRALRLPIYARLGWRCDGFWSVADDPDTVFYTLRWKSLEERAELREALAADEEWTAWKQANTSQLVIDSHFFITTRIG